MLPHGALVRALATSAAALLAASCVATLEPDAVERTPSASLPPAGASLDLAGAPLLQADDEAGLVGTPAARVLVTASTGSVLFGGAHPSPLLTLDASPE